MLERISYRGWDNAYRLFNGVVELVVTADVGPRILFYGFRNGENLLHEVKEDAGKTGGSEFCPQAVATIKASGPTRTLPTLAGYSARAISSFGILRIPKADSKSRWAAYTTRPAGELISGKVISSLNARRSSVARSIPISAAISKCSPTLTSSSWKRWGLWSN